MIVKLSDFILEQTVSNADVIDISMEQAKAEIDVYSALLDVYCKNIICDIPINKNLSKGRCNLALCIVSAGYIGLN